MCCFVVLFQTSQVRNNVITALKTRFAFDDDVLENFQVFEPANWPADRPTSYGAKELGKILHHFAAVLGSIENVCGEFNGCLDRIEVL